MSSNLWAILIVSLLPFGVAKADTLELNDGALVEGKFMGGPQKSIRFKVDEQLLTYPVGEVLAITYHGCEQAANSIPDTIVLLPVRRVPFEAEVVLFHGVPHRRSGSGCFKLADANSGCLSPFDRQGVPGFHRARNLESGHGLRRTNSCPPRSEVGMRAKLYWN